MSDRNCLQCGKKIGSLFLLPTPNRLRGDIPSRSNSVHYMDPNGYFCRLRCAALYGVRAAKASRATASQG